MWLSRLTYISGLQVNNMALLSRIRNITRNQTGSAFLLALLALTVGAVLASAFMSMASSSLKISHNYDNSLDRTYAAQAGVEYAIWQIQSMGLTVDDLPIESFGLSLNNCTIDVRIEERVPDVGGAPNLKYLHSITATATDSGSKSTTIVTDVSQLYDMWSFAVISLGGTITASSDASNHGAEDPDIVSRNEVGDLENEADLLAYGKGAANASIIANGFASGAVPWIGGDAFASGSITDPYDTITGAKDANVDPTLPWLEAQVDLFDTQVDDWVVEATSITKPATPTIAEITFPGTPTPFVASGTNVAGTTSNVPVHHGWVASGTPNDFAKTSGIWTFNEEATFEGDFRLTSTYAYGGICQAVFNAPVHIKGDLILNKCWQRYMWHQNATVTFNDDVTIDGDIISYYGTLYFNDNGEADEDRNKALISGNLRLEPQSLVNSCFWNSYVPVRVNGYAYFRHWISIAWNPPKIHATFNDTFWVGNNDGISGGATSEYMRFNGYQGGQAAVQFKGDVNVEGDFFTTVQGASAAVTFSGSQTARIGGNVSLVQFAVSTSNYTFNGDLHVGYLGGGDLIFSVGAAGGNLTLGTNTIVSGALDFLSGLASTSFTVNGSLHIQDYYKVYSTFGVAMAINIPGTLRITNGIFYHSNLIAGGTNYYQNTVWLDDGDMIISPLLGAAKLKFMGDTYVGGNLTTSGFSSTSALEFGDFAANGDDAPDGNQDTLWVKGTLTIADLNYGGRLSTEDIVYVEDSLIITGAVNEATLNTRRALIAEDGPITINSDYAVDSGMPDDLPFYICREGDITLNTGVGWGATSYYLLYCSGLFYAPNGTVTLGDFDTTGKIYGCFIGQDVEINSSFLGTHVLVFPTDIRERNDDIPGGASGGMATDIFAWKITES